MPRPRTRPSLQHLILIPTGGLCNRMRAIASAARLCRVVDSRCSVLWDWGDFWRFFAPMPGLAIRKSLSAEVDVETLHGPWHVDQCRTVDVGASAVALRSGYVFWGNHESPITLAEVMPYAPALHPRLMRRVDRFSREHLRNAVGFHVRRTDNETSGRLSPDSIFIEKAREVVKHGKRIFLATDNAATELKFRKLFGDSVVVHPKRRTLERRWPRSFDPVATEDDLLDLFLLARTEYVVGSYWSSFSSVAIALNGSPECRILKRAGVAAGPPRKKGLAAALGRQTQSVTRVRRSGREATN
jgi:hypothetical protein